MADFDSDHIEDLIQRAMDNAEKRVERAAMVGFGAGMIAAAKVLEAARKGEAVDREKLIARARRFAEHYMRREAMSMGLDMPLDLDLADLDLDSDDLEG